MRLNVKKVKENAIIPEYSHEGDAGFDLHSCVDCCLEQGQRMLISTGISMAIPRGYVGLIWPRSGLSYKKGVDVLAGVIDMGFRGEIGVVLLNTGYDDLVIKSGDRIAQMLIQPVETTDICEVEDLDETSRSDGCFGSTGGHSSL
jgi:dUTP pyrophosphatase